MARMELGVVIGLREGVDEKLKRLQAAGFTTLQTYLAIPEWREDPGRCDLKKMLAETRFSRDECGRGVCGGELRRHRGRAQDGGAGAAGDAGRAPGVHQVRGRLGARDGRALHLLAHRLHHGRPQRSGVSHAGGGACRSCATTCRNAGRA